MIINDKNERLNELTSKYLEEFLLDKDYLKLVEVGNQFENGILDRWYNQACLEIEIDNIKIDLQIKRYGIKNGFIKARLYLISESINISSSKSVEKIISEIKNRLIKPNLEKINQAIEDLRLKKENKEKIEVLKSDLINKYGAKEYSYYFDIDNVNITVEYSSGYLIRNLSTYKSVSPENLLKAVELINQLKELK